jgi:hypothetical protein
MDFRHRINDESHLLRSTRANWSLNQTFASQTFCAQRVACRRYCCSRWCVDLDLRPSKVQIVEYIRSFISFLIHLAIILWISIATSVFLREVEITSDQVVRTLHRAARTYRPETYSSLQLLQLLTPTDGFHARSVRSSC